MLATVLNRSTDWEPVEENEAGTSPVTAGADLSTALPVYQPPALFPERVADKGIEPPYPIFLPTHVDHDGAVVEAASMRVRMLGGQMSEEEAKSALRLAGWPTDLIPAALRVAWCESKWSPWAEGDSGRSVGWFQTNLQTWFPYFNEDPEQWMDAVTNARVAWRIYQYEQARGYVPFSNWTCRP